MKHYYLANKETGEIVTYSQAKKEFYSKKRTTWENIFDEYEETRLISNENVGELNFKNILNI